MEDKYYYIKENFVSNNRWLKGIEQFNKLMTEKYINLVLGIDIIPREDRKQWEEMLLKVKNKEPAYDLFIKYAMIKAESIPQDIRMELIKTLDDDKLHIVATLEDCKPEEIDYYLKRKNYDVFKDLNQLYAYGELSRRANILILENCGTKELAKMQFLPFRAIDNYYTSDFLYNIFQKVQGGKDDLSQQEIENFYAKIINNKNFPVSLREKIFQIEDIDITRIDNPTFEMGETMINSYLDTLTTKEETYSKKKEIINQKAEDGIHALVHTDCLSYDTLQNLIDTISEEDLDIQLHIFSKVNKKVLPTRYLWDHLDSKDVVDILKNEEIKIYSHEYKLLKNEVSKYYGNCDNNLVNKAFFYHLLTQRKNMDDSVYKEMIKENDSTIEYMMFGSLNVPEKELDAILEKTISRERKENLQFVRFIRKEIIELEKKDYGNYLFVKVADKNTILDAKNNQYLVILKDIVKEIMKETYELYNDDGSKKSLGFRGNIINYFYTKNQFDELEKILKKTKVLYPEKEHVIEKIEKELKDARKRSEFLEKHQKLFEVHLCETGLTYISTNFKNEKKEDVEKLADDLLNLNEKDKEILGSIIDTIQTGIRNTTWSSKNRHMKEICENLAKCNNLYKNILKVKGEITNAKEKEDMIELEK